jgi:hypothetical protein
MQDRRDDVPQMDSLSSRYMQSPGMRSPVLSIGNVKLANLVNRWRSRRIRESIASAALQGRLEEILVFELRKDG